MARLKLLLVALLGAFVALFTIQNLAPVELTVLLWTFESRRVLVIGASLVAGLLIGWTLATLRGR